MLDIIYNDFVLNFKAEEIYDSLIINADSFDWLCKIPEQSIHAIVTDPPYGVKEYEVSQIEKRENGKGGIWRIPPSFDGHKRSPLPRFTALTIKEKEALKLFFTKWSELVIRVLKPGAHVFIASNAFISQLTFCSLVQGGLEFRGEIIRLVQTLRGGDRPKNAEKQFPFVSSLPRGCYEPWGIFRKPIPPGLKLSDCLKEFKTGGLRRFPDGRPFNDVICSERTPQRERAIAPHPSLKPQSFLRQLVYAVLPLGEGIILDPFMGSGSTIAAASAIGLRCIGVEIYSDYYDMARIAIPKLTGLRIKAENQTIKEIDHESSQEYLFKELRLHKSSSKSFSDNQSH